MNSIKKFLTYMLLICMVIPITEARGGGGHGGGMRGGGMHGGMRGGMRGGGMRSGGRMGRGGMRRGPQRAGPSRSVGRGGRGPGRSNVGRGGRGGRGWNRGRGGRWNRGWYGNGWGWGAAALGAATIPYWAGYYGYPWDGYYGDEYPSSTIYVDQPITTNVPVSTSVSSAEYIDDQQSSYWIVINNTPESLLLTNASGDTITLESGAQAQISHTDGFDLHIASLDGQRQTDISSSNHTLNLRIDPNSGDLIS